MLFSLTLYWTLAEASQKVLSPRESIQKGDLGVGHSPVPALGWDKGKARAQTDVLELLPLAFLLMGYNRIHSLVGTRSA